MKINPENGSIILLDGNIIGARTTLDDWIASFPKSSPNHLQAGITFFSLSFTKQSEQYTLTARFEQQRLERLSIFFCPIGEDNSWAAWSEERELQRRKQFAIPLVPLKHRHPANAVDLHGAMQARITTIKTAVR